MTPFPPGPLGAGALACAEPTALVGRAQETALLDGLLAQARCGVGGALVLWGEPGIGTSALLRHAHERAADFVRLTHRAARPEADLPLAGLHGLLRPVADRVESAATPSAAALRAALGSGAEPTNRLQVGAAVLSLLCGLAERQPVLVSVDDGQWLDRATARCLGFVARRVRTHPVVVVLSDHGDPAARPWEGLPDVRLGALSDESARRLVLTAAPCADEAAVRRAVRESGGNPLALLERAGAASGDADASEDGPDGDRPRVGTGPSAGPRVGPRVRRAFRAGMAALRPGARLLTVLAAAEDHGDRLTVRRAGHALGADEADWDAAVHAGLLRVTGDRVGFRHPVVRGAVYEGCGAEERRRVHRALAAALPDGARERAWHLAAAAHDRDEEVATLLERTAVRARRAGAATAAVRAWRRAAELSPAPTDASRRLAGAARAAWDAGSADTAERLLDDAERLAPGAHPARGGRGLRGVLEFARGRPDLAHHYLAADLARAEDPATARELGATALRAAWSAGRGDLRAGTLQRLLAPGSGGGAGGGIGASLLPEWWDDAAAEAAPTGASPSGPAPKAPDPDGGSGPGPDPDARSRALVALARATPPRLLPPTPLAVAWGIDGPMADALRRQAPSLRRGSERARLAVALAQTAVLDAFAGRWEAAESAAAEGLRLAEDAGADHVASQCRACLGWLAAARGDERTVAEATARTLETSLPRGVRALSGAAHWARGMASLFHERPEEALDALTRLTEPGHGAAHPTLALLASLDTAEAAVHVGRHDLAQERARALDAWARRTAAPWARSAAHLVRALLAGPRAEDDFRAALAVPGADSHPLPHARARLLYGEWLRRDRRRTEARVRIEEAAAVFDRLGAAPLRARARRESDLTGPPGRRTDVGAPHRLTPQEQRVARLASEQLTNREIAVRLRISHRTVGHHLANVFAKLGINARTDLGRPRPRPDE